MDNQTSVIYKQTQKFLENIILQTLPHDLSVLQSGQEILKFPIKSTIKGYSKIVEECCLMCVYSIAQMRGYVVRAGYLVDMRYLPRFLSKQQILSLIHI